MASATSWGTGHPYGPDLLAVVRQILRESGQGAQRFDARGWLAGFLNSPSPALGGRRPIALLNDVEGQLHVRQLLLRMQSGAYS